MIPGGQVQSVASQLVGTVSLSITQLWTSRLGWVWEALHGHTDLLGTGKGCPEKSSPLGPQVLSLGASWDKAGVTRGLDKEGSRWLQGARLAGLEGERGWEYRVNLEIGDSGGRKAENS